jgi:transposase
MKLFEPTIYAVPPVRGKRGRPRRRPRKVHGDKGYDYPECRAALTKRGIKVRLARRGIESSKRLGRHRWVIERTFSWLNRFRKLRVRYERTAAIYEALTRLGCCLICYRTLAGFPPKGSGHAHA